jgi:hypothetical protein
MLRHRVILYHVSKIRIWIRWYIQKFPGWVITKETTTTTKTRSEATQRVMAVKLTRLNHKVAIQLHLVAESCTICSSRSRRPVRKLLDTLWYASYPRSTGIKRPEREADHSPPSSAEVKNTWSYTSTPQYVFVAWCLVGHRDNFTSGYSTTAVKHPPTDQPSARFKTSLLRVSGLKFLAQPQMERRSVLLITCQLASEQRRHN